MFSPFSIASFGFLFLYKQGQVGEDVLGYLLQHFPCFSVNKSAVSKLARISIGLVQQNASRWQHLVKKAMGALIDRLFGIHSMPSWICRKWWWWEGWGGGSTEGL